MTLFQALDAPPTTPPVAPSAPTPPGAVGGPLPGTSAPIGTEGAGQRPQIIANRRRLDNRFPVLAFSIRTYGKVWFEVLLATDRTLLDPAAAPRRTPANFYAARQDGGLARATADETAYVVPAAVLRRFAAARPRPTEIFFTVASYDRPDGPPTLAIPVATLATTAPSVALSGDFQAQTLATVLGVPAHKLRALDAQPGEEPADAITAGLADDGVAGQASWSSEDDDAQAHDAAAAAWFADPHAMALDDDTARDGGPDPTAYGAGAEDEWSPVDTAAGFGGATAPDALIDPGAHAYDDGTGIPSDDAYGYPEGTNGYAAGTNGHAAGTNGHGAGPGASSYGYDDDADDQPPHQLGDADEGPYPSGLATGDEGLVDADGFAYDDGFGGASDWSTAASTAWPAGSAEPAALTDEDERRLDAELAMEAGDLEPYGDAASPAALAEEPDADDLAWDDEPSDQADAAAWDDDPTLPAGSAAAAWPDEDPTVPPAAEQGLAGALEAQLDIQTKVGIVGKIGRLFETHDGYSGIAADAEFSNPRLPQYQRWHVGLSFGFIQFTQDSGALGQLLRMMRERDAARFAAIFGADADALLEVTNRPGPSGARVPGGRSARVQPVAGADLWVEPWLSRFRTAGAHPPFQAAQNELAVRRHLDPMLPLAAGLGLTTERGLAMLVDRSIQQGVGGARRWLIDAIGPIRTDAQRQQALGALGMPDLRTFQHTNHLRVDGEFGPLTHAALVGALRHLGPASPIPIPTADQLLDAIVARADASHVWWGERPRAVRTSREFADAPLTWTAPAAR